MVLLVPPSLHYLVFSPRGVFRKTIGPGLCVSTTKFSPLGVGGFGTPRVLRRPFSPIGLVAKYVCSLMTSGVPIFLIYFPSGVDFSLLL